MDKRKLFFDTEFTGLRKNTTLISIGIVAQNGRAFYAELTDYDKAQVDDWLQENVIANLQLQSMQPNTAEVIENTFNVLGSKQFVAAELTKWLGFLKGGFEGQYQMCADCLAYDWVLFCDLFGGSFGVPNSINYIPIDLSTLFYANGIDEDVKRETFANTAKIDGAKHNALYDARVIKACFDKISSKNLIY